jgi:hypothetical protein
MKPSGACKSSAPVRAIKTVRSFGMNYKCGGSLPRMVRGVFKDEYIYMTTDSFSLRRSIQQQSETGKWHRLN